MIQHKMDIPSASAVNYHDADEVCGYQLLLCKIFEREGGLNYPPTTNRLTAAIKREGKIWLREVKKSVAELFASPITSEDFGIGLEDIPRILESYDFFYRICHGAACNEFIRDIGLKSANRYVKGDKSITQAQVALMLLKGMERNILTMEDRYLTFSVKEMECWVNDLERTGKIAHVSENDSYDILNYLLIQDLFAFGIKRDVKLRWIKSYTLSDEVLDSLETKTFLRYIRFNQASEFIAGKSLEEKEAHYISLFSRIAGREDINPFLKEVLAIDLAKYRTA